ncbi:MAG: UDP-N-acetylmuramoyl-tripeptide--D-alanyl-D-alanine ligase, partial [Desulfobulbaceae bacterium]|nr:UDP-N-acetylmuramoyl-tripeptide--D-alanyl-D-alanine ligase [Desulfobulbaceae bacterium]
FQALPHVNQVAGRLEKVCLPGRQIAPHSPLVVVDYAHTPDALENVLGTLRGITSGRMICVFGCGGDRDRGKRRTMGMISGRLADVSLATSDNPRSEEPQAILLEIEKGLVDAGANEINVAEFACSPEKRGYLTIQDRRRAIVTACSLAQPGDVILIAGKGHETYQLIGSEKHFFDDRLEALNGLLTWNQSHLLAATGGKIIHGAQHDVPGDIVTDSRMIQPAQIFLALKGDNFNGHDYLGDVVAKGAKVLISEVEFNPGRDDVLVLLVPDTLRALGDLAAYRRALLGDSLRVIGITGSCGKTTVKEMTAAILAQHHPPIPGQPDPILKTLGNFNNLIGLPLTLLGLRGHHRIAVLEMGMNRPGEISRLTEIADPDVGCITNVHAAHLEGLGDINGVAKAKGELFVHMRPEACRVINFDDPLITQLTGNQSSSTSVGFAQKKTTHFPSPEIFAQNVSNLGPGGLSFELHYGNQTATISLAVGGLHNLTNSLAATAICYALSIPNSCIAPGLRSFQPIDKRMQILKLADSIMVLNDCYNANPGSMRAALSSISESCGQTPIKAAALGDMLELGVNSPALHRELGNLVGQLGYDYLAVFGEFSTFVADGAMEKGMKKESIAICSDRDQMAGWLAGLIHDGSLPPGSWILIKGSRGMHMERMLSRLEELIAPVSIGS